MSKNFAQLEQEAGQLYVKDRAKLVHRLIASLEHKDDGDIEQSWLDEAQKRLAAYRRGETNSRFGEDVFSEILSRL